MQKLFILFFALVLLTSCNDSNPFARKDKGAGDKEKKEKDDRSRDDDEDAGKKKDNDEEDTKSNWTSTQRDKWLKECINAAENNPQARKVCDCVLDKMEKKYPDSKDAENASEAEGTRLAKNCMEDLGVTNGSGGVGEGDRTENRDDVVNNRGGNWTNLQRKKFIQGCAATAQQAQGFSADRANTYCDCMTRKIEKKYSFDEAARLTAADLQTQEWADAADDCRGRY